MTTPLLAKRPRLTSTARVDHFLSIDGLKIFYRAWRPDIPPRAIVVVAPGFNAHSGHYEWAARQLIGKGLAVYAIDHRGRGESEGERYFVNAISEYVEDLSTLINVVKARDPGLRVFLLGHSAGGVISCTYALDRQNSIDGLICESFAFKIPTRRFALTLIKGLSHVAPHAHVLKLPNKHFSRDPEVVAALDADPYVADEKQPTATLAAMTRADERLGNEFPKIVLPVLILHGTDDKVTDPEGSQIFFEAVGSPDKTLKLYEGYFHDLLADIDKEIVIADIEAWIAARLRS